MKSLKYAVLALVAIGCAGCERQESTNAAYVVSHKCVTDGIVKQPSSSAVVVDGKEEKVYEREKPYFEYEHQHVAYVYIPYDDPSVIETEVGGELSEDQGFTGPLTIVNHGNHCTTPTKEHPTCVR